MKERTEFETRRRRRSSSRRLLVVSFAVKVTAHLFYVASADPPLQHAAPTMLGWPILYLPSSFSLHAYSALSPPLGQGI